MGGADFLEAFRVDEVDLFAVLDIAAAGGDGLADLGLGGAAGVEAKLDVVGVGGFRDLRGELGRLQVGGVFLEIVGELRAEVLAQRAALGGEDVEDAVAVAQPPLAGEGIEDEAVVAEELQHTVVGGGLARRQGEGEEMLRAIDDERGEGGGGGGCPRFGWRALIPASPGPQGRGSFWGGSLTQQVAHAGEFRAVPGEGDLRRAAVEEDRLAGEGGDEIAQLRAGELDQGDRGGFDAEALQQGEGGQEIRGETAGRRSGLPVAGCCRPGASRRTFVLAGLAGRCLSGPVARQKIELDLQGHGVARDGGGEVGRQEEAEHGGRRN
ncbi:hypothetical protein [Lacunisphaera limnophila]|uniref:hypothetical protein n=1 Tax=Lacunisphaera limnophila TaxID=1838286 RepID=UPI0008597EBC|nr:hypothetical protein [Lacunisphaera limnophila]